VSISILWGTGGVQEFKSSRVQEFIVYECGFERTIGQVKLTPMILPRKADGSPYSATSELLQLLNSF
jgi:hypothetical protein